MSEQVLNSGQGDAIFKFYLENGKEATLEKFGISEVEFMDLLTYPQIEEYDILEGNNVEGVNQSMIDMNSDDFAPDYTATAKYEGPGRDDVTINTSGDIDRVLLGMVGPGGKAKAVKGMLSGAKNLMSTKGGKLSDILMKPPGIGKTVANKESANKLANKVFASKSLKANQKANRGVEGPVVKGTSKTLKDSNLRPAIKQKVADRYKAMSDKVAKDRATKTAIAGSVATGIGLMGNRNENGDFVPVPEIVPETVPEIVPETVPETMGNQFGYHKRPGQNFWTIDDSDPYWDTHDKEGSSAFEEAPLKQQPQQELDWDFWFK